jgi:hypothetical protein
VIDDAARAIDAARTAADEEAVRDLVLDLICLGPLGLALAGERSEEPRVHPAARRRGASATALAAARQEETR